MNEIHEALARHDEEHYYLPTDDPAVLACVFCEGGEDERGSTGHAPDKGGAG